MTQNIKEYLSNEETKSQKNSNEMESSILPDKFKETVIRMLIKL